MGKSLIQTTNQTSQNVEENGIISLGSVLRRYGCNCRLSGNAIEVSGQGYYAVDVSVTVAPTAAGDVTVALFGNNVQIPSAIATVTAADGGTVTLPITTTIRQVCNCEVADSLTVVLIEGSGVVSNISARVVKE